MISSIPLEVYKVISPLYPVPARLWFPLSEIHPRQPT